MTRRRLSNRQVLARAGRSVVTFRGVRRARRAAVVTLLWDLAVFGKADLDGGGPPLAVKTVAEWQRIVDAVLAADAEGSLGAAAPVLVHVNGVLVDGPPLPVPLLAAHEADADHAAAAEDASC